MYNEIRESLFVTISTIEINFRQLLIDNQFLEILSNPLYYRFVSKAMYAILKQTSVCHAKISNTLNLMKHCSHVTRYTM